MVGARADPPRTDAYGESVRHDSIVSFSVPDLQPFHDELLNVANRNRRKRRRMTRSNAQREALRSR